MTNQVSLGADVVMPVIALVSGFLVAAFPVAKPSMGIYASNVLVWFVLTMFDVGQGLDFRCIILNAIAAFAWALAFIRADFKRRTSRS